LPQDFSSTAINSRPKVGTVISTGREVRKHFRLDSIKMKRAQKPLQARTKTETVERIIDLTIAEHQPGKLAEKARRKFRGSGVVIRDAFGTVNNPARIRKARCSEGPGVRGKKQRPGAAGECAGATHQASHRRISGSGHEVYNRVFRKVPEKGIH
jgi:hypothetical protein